MSTFRINRLGIVTIYICSVFVTFIALLGVLHFRSETLACSDALKTSEMMCEKIKNISTTLTFSTLQKGARNGSYDISRYPEQLLQEHMMCIANWDEYKKSFVMRNALALNLDQRR